MENTSTYILFCLNRYISCAWQQYCCHIYISCHTQPHISWWLKILGDLIHKPHISQHVTPKSLQNKIWSLLLKQSTEFASNMGNWWRLDDKKICQGICIRNEEHKKRFSQTRRWGMLISIDGPQKKRNGNKEKKHQAELMLFSLCNPRSSTQWNMASQSHTHLLPPPAFVSSLQHSSSFTKGCKQMFVWPSQSLGLGSPPWTLFLIRYTASVARDPLVRPPVEQVSCINPRCHHFLFVIHSVRPLRSRWYSFEPTGLPNLVSRLCIWPHGDQCGWKILEVSIWFILSEPSDGGAKGEGSRLDSTLFIMDGLQQVKQRAERVLWHFSFQVAHQTG